MYCFFSVSCFIQDNKFKTIKFVLICFAISIFVITNTYADDTLPGEFEASFTLLKNKNKVGELNTSLTKVGKDEYIYKSNSKTTGLISIFYTLKVSEESHWHVVNNQISSISYSYHRVKNKKEENLETKFNWEKMQARNIENNEESLVGLETGMLDKLNYQIQIMRDLKSNKKPVTYTIINNKKIKIYNFTFLGNEEIETPLGKFNSLKFLIQKPGDKRKSIIWCADKFDYLPIRVDSIEKDDSITTAIINKYTDSSLSDSNNQTY